MSPPETQNPRLTAGTGDRGGVGDIACARLESSPEIPCAATGSSGTRGECLRVLERLIGADAVPGWLKLRQPALDDETGGRLLQRDPERLLRHLRMLDAQLSGDDEEALTAPILDRPTARRSDRDAGRVLSILDELDREGGIA